MGNVGEIPKKVKNKYTLFCFPKETKGKLKKTTLACLVLTKILKYIITNLRKENEEKREEI